MDSTLVPPQNIPNANSSNNNNNNGNNQNNNHNLHPTAVNHPANTGNNAANNANHGQNMINTNGALTPGATGLSAAAASTNNMMGGLNLGEANYDFFDPQNWMLDGLLDFNYSFVPPLEGA